ncbi:MAG: 3-oxoacyl-[acyl-carrier-protein] synthase III C-terminal domain-containing protein, partial [Bacteroidota bacterium]
MYINAIAHYVPETVIPNAYFEPVNGLTHEWIETRTGIRERRKAAASENTNTLAISALERLVSQLPYATDKVNLIVGATYSPYDTVATLAHAVQHHLDLPPVPAVSISSACSSLLNAVEIVEGYFATGKADHAIVVAAEHNTAFSNETDKVAGHLWGDGAVAIAFSKEPQSPNDLTVKALTTAGAASVGKGMEGVVLRPQNGGIHMPHGRDVFIHAVQYMSRISKELLCQQGYSLDQVRYFIPHQANFRISKKVAEELELPIEKVVSNIQYLGNTGCAGCGIGLSEK